MTDLVKNLVKNLILQVLLLAWLGYGKFLAWLNRRRWS